MLSGSWTKSSSGNSSSGMKVRRISRPDREKQDDGVRSASRSSTAERTSLWVSTGLTSTG